MKINQIIITLTFFVSISIHAQKTYSSKLLDSTTQKPIPFATIQFNSKTGVITNDNGEFSITIKRAIKSDDYFIINCLGYKEKKIQILNYNNETIYLKQQSVDLDEVYITNKEYTIDEILEKIKESLNTNYDFSYTKRKLFFRESYYTKIDKSDVKLKKSTIPEINQQLIDSLLRDIPKENGDHTEILGELYGKIEPQQFQKMEIFKATRLHDEANDINLDNYEKKFNAIFKKHVKRDSYFKIKSGWFSTKEEIDSTLYGDQQAIEKDDAMTQQLLAEKRKKDSLRKTGFLKWRKLVIHQKTNDNFIDEDNDLNFIHKSRRYEFKIKDYVYMNGLFVYVITFEPKRKEDFKGTMYVNTDDFAVVRVDYENVKPLSTFSLLGISMKKYLKQGTIIFQKNENDKYSLKYMDETFGEQVGIKRPIKIIEKNKNVKGRRQQNMVRGDIHFIVRNIEKTELIVFETETITETDFKNFKEKANVLPTYLNKYDPDFWKGYNIIEPNQAIKEFKIIESN